jgi:hypothetical protein
LDEPQSTTETIEMKMEGFKVMEWLSQVREEHYELLKDKTHEEQISLYREGARIAEERAKKRRLELKR